MRRTAPLIAATVLLLSGATQASATPADAPSDYLQNPKAKQFMAEINRENAYPADKLKLLLGSAQKMQSILDAISRPAEKTKSWAEYRPIFLTQDRIDKGVEFYHQHADTFQRAEQEFGVSRFIVLAIIGVETRYGNHKGNYRVVDALSTLAFDYPPRSAFFRSELKHFLQLENEAHIDLMTAKGSYAGAMGYGQFIASSYRNFAVDFDNDGHRDLINNPVDAIGSVANYFKQHGWKQGEPVASVARNLASEESSAALNKILQTGPKPTKPSLTILDIRNAGLMADTDYPDNAKAVALKLDGTAGPEYWIALQNFYVITRYNHSPLYAMAVYQLSEELKKRLSS